MHPNNHNEKLLATGEKQSQFSKLQIRELENQIPF